MVEGVCFTLFRFVCTEISIDCRLLPTIPGVSIVVDADLHMRLCLVCMTDTAAVE